jgi:hypothetical protein
MKNSEEKSPPKKSPNDRRNLKLRYETTAPRAMNRVSNISAIS